MKSRMIVGLVPLLLGGCFEMNPKPLPIAVNDAHTLVEHIQCIKASNGLCFGVVTVERTSTNAAMALNQMIVAVDCARVGL